jgi:RiboL-PSP-HEPN
MNNQNATQLIIDCENELLHIKQFLDVLGPFNNMVPYLTKYSVIKASGTIEQSFKTIIADFCEQGQSAQIKAFITTKLRNSSSNPSLENILGWLGQFDQSWKINFKKKLNNKSSKTLIKSSLKSLNEARNGFAHGGNPSSSFADINKYFNHAVIILNILDDVVK